MLSFIALGLAGALLLGFVRQPALRSLGRLLTIGAAAGATALAIGLYRLGASQGWTGDGPGIFVVMLLIPTAGVLALAGWSVVFAQGRLARDGGIGPGLPLLLLAVAVAGGTQVAFRHAAVSRPSHDAPVIALGFASDGSRLLSLDEAGVLKAWDPASGRLQSQRADPALARSSALLVTPDGDCAVALGSHGAVIVRLDGAASAVTTLPGVGSAALLPGERLAWARGDELHVDALREPRAPGAATAVGAPITALASDREGTLALAIADGRLLALAPDGEARRELGSLPAPAVRLALSPGGAWLLAVDADGRAVVADLRRGWLRPLAHPRGLHHAVFVTEDALVFTAAAADPVALSLSLATREPAPRSWLNHGQVVTAMGAAPGAPRAAVALGREIFLARAPGGEHGYVSDAERLVPVP